MTCSLIGGNEMANERPTFGAKHRLDNSANQPEEQQESQITQKQSVSTTDSKSGSQAPKMKFGVQSATTNKEQADSTANYSFGVSGGSQTGNTGGGVVQELFQLKDKSFWLKAYGLSVVFWLFLANGQFSLTTLLNVILFPFVLILLAEIAELLSGMPTIAQWLYPATNQLSREGWLKRVLWYGSKLALYFILWKFSFILGLIGVVMLVKAMIKSRG